jgi:hypothetical protein
MANFYQYNGSIYRLTTAVAWKQAQAQAQSLGGNLVTVNNQAEQERLICHLSLDRYLNPIAIQAITKSVQTQYKTMSRV